MTTEVVEIVNPSRFLAENENRDDYDRAELRALIPYKDSTGLLEIICELDLPTLEMACQELDEVVNEKLLYVRDRIWANPHAGYTQGEELELNVAIVLLSDVVEGEIIDE